jgi:hypothetical protein
MFDDEPEQTTTENRAFYRYLFLALMIPAIAVSTLALFAEDHGERTAVVESERSVSAAFLVDLFTNDDQRLKRAAAYLDNFTRLNPPNGVWRQQGVEVVDGKTLRMQVEVPYRQHAQAIMTRRERIQYSYVKLACPPADSGVGEFMASDDRIVVELLHNGESIAEGTCPRHPFSL